LNKTDLVSPAELLEVEARIRAINPFATLHKTTRSQVPLSAVLDRGAFDLERILTLEPDFLKTDDGHHHHDHHGHSHGHSGHAGHEAHSHDHAHHHDGHKHEEHNHGAHHDAHKHDEHCHDETCNDPTHNHHGGLKHYHDEDMLSISLKCEKPLDPETFFPWIQDLCQEHGPAIVRSKGILSFKDDPDRFVFQGVHMILDGDHQRPWREGEARESRLVFIGKKEMPVALIKEGFAKLSA
jgi:G3E family GTPase